MKYTACAKKSWRYQLQSKNNLTASYNICNLTSTFFYSRRCHLLNLLSFVSFLSPSGDLGIGLVWDNHPTPPHQTTTHFLVRLLKSSSNRTKSSMMGHQLFLGWYQMILDVFRCSQLFTDVFSWAATFMPNHPLCGNFFSGWCQMFSDVP